MVRTSSAAAPGTTTRAATNRWTVALTAGFILWAVVAPAQPDSSPAPRRSAGRSAVRCGGDSLDDLCPTGCSGSPLDRRYDADCFSCDVFASPSPAPACQSGAATCEVHLGIDQMGAMFESGAYRDDVMREVVLAYWDSAAWDLPDRWGAHGLDGYVVYAVVRTALRFRGELEGHPTTRMALECMLHDHGSRGLPTTADNSERWFHGGVSPWNSWSEDYMGFALGYASADAWFASPWHDGFYGGEYRGKAEAAVELAFSVSDGAPQTLRREVDPDPLGRRDAPSVMLRNHDEYSPVYAMLLLKHVGDVNGVYRAASLPPAFTCSNKPATFDELYAWVRSKIEPNPEGPAYVFRPDGCEREDGELSYCDDRPGDPAGTGGDWREPGHYPLQQSLADLCIDQGLEYFGPPCGHIGPAGIVQADHNYYFNCVFSVDEGAWPAVAASP